MRAGHARAPGGRPWLRRQRRVPAVWWSAPRRHPRAAMLLVLGLALTELWLAGGAELFTSSPPPTTYVASDQETLALLSWRPILPPPATPVEGASPTTAGVPITGAWRLVQAPVAPPATKSVHEEQGPLHGRRLSDELLLVLDGTSVRGWLVHDHLRFRTPLRLDGTTLAFWVWQRLPPALSSEPLIVAFQTAIAARAALTLLAADLQTRGAPPTAASLLPPQAQPFLTRLRTDLVGVTAAAATACTSPAAFAAALGRFTSDADASPDPLALPFASAAALLARNPVAQDLAVAQRAVAAAQRAIVAPLQAGAASLVQPWAVSTIAGTTGLEAAQHYERSLTTAASQAITDVQTLRRQATDLKAHVYALAVSVHC
jgi:hypothetical protein